MFKNIFIIFLFLIFSKFSIAQLCAPYSSTNNLPPAPPDIAIVNLVNHFSTCNPIVSNDYTEAFKRAENFINARGGYVELKIPYIGTPYFVGKEIVLPSDPNNNYIAFDIVNTENVKITGIPDGPLKPIIKFKNNLKIGMFDPISGAAPSASSSAPYPYIGALTNIPTSFIEITPVGTQQDKIGFKRDNITGKLLCPWYIDEHGDYRRSEISPVSPNTTNNIWSFGPYYYNGYYKRNVGTNIIQAYVSITPDPAMFDIYSTGPGIIFKFSGGKDITITDVDFNGNKNALNRGGTYGNTPTSYERLAYNLEFNDCRTVHIENVDSKYAGLDNLYVHDVLFSEQPSQWTNFNANHCNFMYSGRNNVSFLSGNHSTFNYCNILGAGYSENPSENQISSSPAAGISLESEGRYVQSLTLNNCISEKNLGQALADAFILNKDNVYNNCTFRAGKYYVAHLGTSNNHYNDCTFYGSVVHNLNTNINPDPILYPNLITTSSFYSNCHFKECDGINRYFSPAPYLFGYFGINAKPPKFSGCDFTAFTLVPLILQYASSMGPAELKNSEVFAYPNSVYPSYLNKGSIISNTNVLDSKFYYPYGFFVDGLSSNPDAIANGNLNYPTSVHTQACSPNPQTCSPTDPIEILEQIEDVCEGVNYIIPLNLGSLAALTNVTYEWTGPNGILPPVANPTISNFSYSNHGIYICKVNSALCSNPIVTYKFRLNFKPKPILTLNSNSPLCINNTSLNLTATCINGPASPPANAPEFTWTNTSGFFSNEKDPTIYSINFAAYAGVYTCTVMQGGCTSTATTTVNVIAAVRNLKVDEMFVSNIGTDLANVTLSWIPGPNITTNYQLKYKKVTDPPNSWTTVQAYVSSPHTLLNLEIGYTYLWKIVTVSPNSNCSDQESEAATFTVEYCTSPNNPYVIALPISASVPIAAQHIINITGNISIDNNNFLQIHAGDEVNLFNESNISIAALPSNNNALFEARIQPCIPITAKIAKSTNNIVLAKSAINANKEGENKSLDIITIYPNPANDLLKIASDKSKIISIKILNNLAEIIYTKVDRGTNLLIIPVKNFSNGMYFIEIILADNKKIFTKFIKF